MALYSDPRAYVRRLRVPFGVLHRRASVDARAAAPRGGAVLDIGCGPGLLPVRIARARLDLHVTGIDPSNEMVGYATELARRRQVADRVVFVTGTASRLPAGDAAFDVAVATASW